MNSERSNDNFIPSLRVKSNAGDGADVVLWADPTTHRLLVSVSGGASGGTSAIDDAAFTAGSDSGTPMMGFATADSVDSGDVGVVGMTTARAMFVYIKGSDVATGGTSMIDDAAFTPGTTAITPMGAMFDDVAPDSVNEGDGGVVRMSANRNLYVTLRDAAGNERGLNIAADGSLAITVASIPSHAVTNAGTFVVQENGAALTALQKIDDPVIVDDAAFTPATSSVMMAGFTFDDVAPDTVNEGDAGAPRMSADRIIYVQGALAHDAVDAGNPLKVGGQARTTNPTAVADADRSNFITDKLGKQVVVGSIRDLKTTQATTITSSTSETTVLTAVASTFLDVYGCIVANSSATAVRVTFKDSTAGTTRFDIYVPAGETRGFMLPESAAHNQATVNTNWTATCSASVASVYITMLAVKNI